MNFGLRDCAFGLCLEKRAIEPIEIQFGSYVTVQREGMLTSLLGVLPTRRECCCSKHSTSSGLRRLLLLAGPSTPAFLIL